MRLEGCEDWFPAYHELAVDRQVVDLEDIGRMSWEEFTIGMGATQDYVRGLFGEHELPEVLYQDEVFRSQSEVELLGSEMFERA